MSSRRALAVGLSRMTGRDPAEAVRSASSLELFFDLAFVVAVSQAADELLHFDERGHPWLGLEAYCFAFFGIWWAWVGFTWFASAFDTDDWAYRLLTIVQIGGVLVYAAGIPAVMERFDLAPGVTGYVIIRLAQVAQYLRAARSSTYRSTELRYAVGVAALQCLWISAVLLPVSLRTAAFLALVALEVAVPVVAERGRPTPFHRGHIADRYGAFTLIVLGEGLIPVTGAVVAALQDGTRLLPLAVVGVEALVLVAGMWWVYFAREQRERLASASGAFAYGYAHYAVFAAAGAVAAGVESVIAAVEHGRGAPPPAVLVLTTAPVAVFVAVVWALALRPAASRRTSAVVLALTAVIAASALLPSGLVVAALAMVGVVAALEVDGRRGPTGSPAPPAGVTRARGA